MRIYKSLVCIACFLVVVSLLGFLAAPVHFAGIDAVCQSLSHKEMLEKMMDVAGVEAGMIIGEIGAGGGDLTFPVAERVGPNGMIYANDISKASLDYIDEKGVRNIVTVLGESDDPVFPVKNLDMAIMKNVFHDLENPLSLMENLKRYLKPGASFVLIEPHRSKEDRKTALSFHEMTQEQLLGVVEKSSFRLVQPEASPAPGWTIYVLKVDVEKQKAVWTNWLAEFRSMIEKVNGLERDKNISLIRKRIAWERAFDSYRDNDPESEEDELLREYISKKIALLRKEKEKSAPIQKDTPRGKRLEDCCSVCLRAKYKQIDGDDYLETLKRLGFKAEFRVGSGDFPNQFDPQSINEDDVVVDKASGLMWHHSGSETPLDFFAAQEWIDDLNIQRYAGYSDWRLPTTEELLSLIETDKMNGDVRIDPLFSNVQSVIWTGDDDCPGRSWAVNFHKSMATLWGILKINPSWVRPVRASR
jgi:SAM-dependent methyltransferase